MAIIDPHHHLWDLNTLRYPWLDEKDKTAFFGSYAPLAKNYTVDDYLADAGRQGLERTVHLQAECDHEDCVAETRWLTSLAEQHGRFFSPGAGHVVSRQRRPLLPFIVFPPIS